LISAERLPLSRGTLLVQRALVGGLMLGAGG
jgi:hypothetical protein